jgi:RNA polymerase-binding transcription factor DksA
MPTKTKGNVKVGELSPASVVKRASSPGRAGRLVRLKGVTRVSPGKARSAISRATKAKVALSAAEKKQVRLRLQEEAERLKQVLDELTRESAVPGELEGMGGEEGGFDDVPADMALETFEKEKGMAAAEAVELALSKVRIAQEKVEAGTYGLCDMCGQPIGKKRLKALPYATFCIDCQERLEVR